jgi:hypothetical protein
MPGRAFINEHDTIVFEDDILASEEESGVGVQNFLDAGYREVTEDDRIVPQAAEADPHFGGMARDVLDSDKMSMADLPDGDAQIMDYISRVRDLRKRNDRARAKKQADDAPVVVRKATKR